MAQIDWTVLLHACGPYVYYLDEISLNTCLDTYKKVCKIWRSWIIPLLKYLWLFKKYGPNLLKRPIACIWSVCLLSRCNSIYLESSVYNFKKLCYSVFEIFTMIQQIWPKLSGPSYYVQLVRMSSIQIKFHWIHV